MSGFAWTSQQLIASTHYSVSARAGYYSVSTSLLKRVTEFLPFVHRIRFTLFLRPRLTLIRLALIRNPWSFGGRVSRPPSRYLCLHLLFHTLQKTSRPPFSAYGMLPYHSRESAASVACFMPVYYPCIGARPVSCYALFKCLAASKPTSWLSLLRHRVIFNLTRIWGP